MGIAAGSTEINIDTLRDAVRKKRPENYKKKKLISPSLQCSSTPVGFGQGFMSKEQYDSTRASPIYS